MKLEIVWLIFHVIETPKSGSKLTYQKQQAAKLTHKEISKLFGVARTAITRINSGERWSEIQIDENGNCRMEEIAPENFPVYVEKEDETKITKIDDKTTEYRLQFLDDYFVKKIKDNGRSSIVTQFEVSTPKSRRFIGSLWKSYGWLFNNENDDFMSMIMFSVTKKVMTFKPINSDFEWSKVVISGTKENTIMHDNINKIIKTDLHNYANKINNSYKVEIDGEAEWCKPVTKSLDEVASTEDGDFPLMDELGEESNLFYIRNDYIGSHFLDWFRGEHDKVLTAGQIRYLNVMKLFQRDRNDDYTIPYNQLPNECKPYTESAIDHNRQRLKKRVEDAYDQVPKLSLREMNYMKEINFFESFMEIVEIEDERIDEQNGLLEEWIKSRVDNDFLSNLLFEMDADDIVAINSSKRIKNKDLYKIVGLVENRIASLRSLLDEK
ncbi:hypothetical protein ACM26V_16900 [Salipaludibacillus sp. HK11]|uniref:hypothetical protein n=1 Tax=Salipaludibacillus sp. HK11 TaxID=3394320 RepID=UPI0039FCF88D